MSVLPEAFPLLPATKALGWALAHFLWQGSLAAGVLWALQRTTRTPRWRHLQSCAALLLCVLLAMGTALHELLRLKPGTLLPAAAFTPPPAAPSLMLHPTPLSAGMRWELLLDRALPWLVLAWALGVLLLGARLLGGWIRVRRMDALAELPAEPSRQAKLAVLARRMGLDRVPLLKASSRVDGPVVLGWLRPVVLVPTALLTGLDPELLEALLAHELAHVLRRDYLVNLLQGVAEVLLFYHPAVWWISRRIRIERELACDERAGEACGSLRLARALSALDDYQFRSPALALGAHGGELLERVKRLLDPLPQRSPRLGSLLALPALLLAGGVTLALKAQTPAVEKIHAPAGLVREVDDLARAEGLDPALLRALVQTESAFDPRARSSWGALGLLQVMPETAKRFGAKDLEDPAQVARAGARYLRWLLDRYKGDWEKAVCAYNAGEVALESGQLKPENLRYRDEVLRLARAGAVEPEAPLAQGDVEGELRPSRDGRAWFLVMRLSHQGSFAMELAEDQDGGKVLASMVMGNTDVPADSPWQESRPKIRLGEDVAGRALVMRFKDAGGNVAAECHVKMGQGAQRFKVRMARG